MGPHLLLIVGIFGTLSVANASHLLGGHSNYLCLGNGDYLLQQWMYFDCQGPLPPASVDMVIYDQSGNQQSVQVLNKVYAVQLPIQIDSCYSTPWIPCVIEAYYEAVSPCLRVQGAIPCLSSRGA